jgi:CheY-like chemotaxis protein
MARTDKETILLAEDRRDDVDLLKFAFKRARITNPLVVVDNGQQAIDYISGHGVYSDRANYPLPELILLDLRMPHVNGFEFMEWLRSQPQAQTIPVVAVADFSAGSDKIKARQAGAWACVSKPVNLEAFTESMAQVIAAWRMGARFWQALEIRGA